MASGAAWAPDRGGEWRASLNLRLWRSRALSGWRDSGLGCNAVETTEESSTSVLQLYLFPMLPPKKDLISNFHSLGDDCLTCIKGWPWSTTAHLFHGKLFFNLFIAIPRVPLSLDFLTNTCGPGAEGEVLLFISVLQKGSDCLCVLATEASV